MKAIRVKEYGDESKLKLCTDIPIPQPLDDEVVVCVHAAGINPVDTYVRTGTSDYPGIGAEVPYTPGFDGAGVVHKLGKSVTDFKVGDRVIVVFSQSGTYAQYCTVKAIHLCLLHDDLSFNQGAAIGIPYYTAQVAIFNKAEVKAKETVLVHGASGAVGIATVQTLKAHGCDVIGTAGTSKGKELVAAQGADKVCIHKEGHDYMDKLGKVDVILEMLADKNLVKDLEAVEPRGKIVVIGCRDRVTVDMRVLMVKEIAILGMVLVNVQDHEWPPLHAAIKKGQEDGWLKPVVDRTYSLDEAAQAHKDVMAANKGSMGKVVFEIDPHSEE